MINDETLLHELKCRGDYEADFLIGDHTAIEVKAKASVGPQDLRSLRAIGEERTFKRLICVSLETRRRQVGDITILPYGQFLDRLWAGDFQP